MCNTFTKKWKKKFALNIKAEAACLTLTLFFFFCYRSYRYAGYRMFTYWVHGLLGRGVRRVILVCAVELIRSTFPKQIGIMLNLGMNSSRGGTISLLGESLRARGIYWEAGGGGCSRGWSQVQWGRLEHQLPALCNALQVTIMIYKKSQNDGCYTVSKHPLAVFARIIRHDDRVRLLRNKEKENVAEDRRKLEMKEITVCGDGRCDSPGHSAKYCSYTMMNMSTNKIKFKCQKLQALWQWTR